MDRTVCVRQIMSDSFSGSVLALEFKEALPGDTKALKFKLDKAVEVEDYESACIIRDLLN